MTPTEFPGHNTVFAKDQEPYLPLPAYVDSTPGGEVITCWRLTWWERLRVLFTGTLWLRQLTFHASLQPQRPQVEYPFLPSGYPAGQT